ncbi:MAG: DUF1254 domain-containing protein [Caulobacteraceae bacterium]|nr:DUF1254 domain-containing protein [Caulobacteraceae bacterium]
MQRRTVIVGAAATAAVAGAASAGEGAPMRQLGYDGLIYALPIYEMMATRSRTLQRHPFQNAFAHSRRLSTAKSRDVTTPNNDTLYSTAWLDLQSPVEIALPTAGARYFSLALMDAYTNAFVVLGDAGREGASRVRLVHGQAAVADDGVRTIRSPTRHVWALGRTYVAGSHDLDAAGSVQEQLSIATPPLASSAPPAPPRADLLALLKYANAAMSADPPPERDAPILSRLAAVGIGPGAQFPPSEWSSNVMEDVLAGAAQALSDLRVYEARQVQGWYYAKPNTGLFDVDYRYRAHIALTGLAALPIAEAFYLQGVGDSGDRLYDGAIDRKMVFREGLPPTDGFWSVALYQVTAQGQLFFYDNPPDRYSIGSNSGALHAAADGSVTLLISSREPEDPAMRSNWLPAPAGPYRLQFRAFRPGAALVSETYRVPPVERAG